MQFKVFLQFIRSLFLHLRPLFFPYFSISLILSCRQLVIIVRVDANLRPLHYDLFRGPLPEPNIRSLLFDKLLLLNSPVIFSLLHPTILIKHLLNLGL